MALLDRQWTSMKNFWSYYTHRQTHTSWHLLFEPYSNYSPTNLEWSISRPSYPPTPNASLSFGKVYGKWRRQRTAFYAFIFSHSTANEKWKGKKENWWLLSTCLSQPFTQALTSSSEKEPESHRWVCWSHSEEELEQRSALWCFRLFLRHCWLWLSLKVAMRGCAPRQSGCGACTPALGAVLPKPRLAPSLAPHGSVPSQRSQVTAAHVLEWNL